MLKSSPALDVYFVEITSHLFCCMSGSSGKETEFNLKTHRLSSHDDLASEANDQCFSAYSEASSPLQSDYCSN